MDGPTIQARVYAGYARAAARIGLLYDQFRPITAQAPLGNKIQSLLAAFDSTPDYKFKKPNDFGDPTWYALINDATVMPGDYLVGNGQTFFIAGKQFLLPVQAVECNRSVVLIRPAAPSSSTGAQGYGGNCIAEGSPALGTLNPDGSIATGWPCSILFGGKQSHGTELPMSVSNAGFQILLPPSLPLVVNASDVFLDDFGRRYIAEACEKSDLGWRINAKEVHP